MCEEGREEGERALAHRVSPDARTFVFFVFRPPLPTHATQDCYTVHGAAALMLARDLYKTPAVVTQLAGELPSE